ncbi:MAG: hypothetical protein NTZ19_10390 [Bacteroidetes bacterium]|nr:hypothetical protein [Bacteroidota bacterium]
MKPIIIFIAINFFALVGTAQKTWTCVSGDCENGIGTFNYDRGESYTGQWKNGKAMGEGTIINKDGVYNGQVKYFLTKEGMGTFTNNANQVFKGQWKNDEMNGEGTYDWEGKSYSGHWKDGKYDGEGTYNDGKGTSYSGHWKNGKRDGKGSQTDAKFGGRISSGNWDEGYLSGAGMEMYPNGYYMKATFKKDFKVVNERYFNNQNQKITYQEFKTKNPYKFCAEGNCYTGLGTCEFDYVREIFIGNWLNGKRQGFVAEFSGADNFYFGIWNEDTLVSKIDEKEAQKYLTAQRSNFLKLFKSAMKYSASKSNPIAKAAALIEGCNNGECTSGNCDNGFGSYVDCSGGTYNGIFKNGVPFGQGTYTYARELSIQKFTHIQQQQMFEKTTMKGIWNGTKMSGSGSIYTEIKSYDEKEFEADAGATSTGTEWVRMEHLTVTEYKGDFSDGKLNGYGYYETYWKIGLRRVDDTEPFIGSEKYLGQFKNNLYNGKGKLYIWLNGAYQLTNEGEFLNGKYMGPSR